MVQPQEPGDPGGSAHDRRPGDPGGGSANDRPTDDATRRDRGHGRDTPGGDAGGRDGAARPGPPADEAGPDERPDEQAPVAPVRRPTPLTQQLGRLVVLLLLVLFVVFAVDNSQPVDFSWVFGSTSVRDDPTGQGTSGGVPLILLLVVTFVIGAVIGVLLEWQYLRGRRARRDGKGR